MLKVHSIASELPFLRVLARAVLAGFPVPGQDVSRLTILVPNRRSARNLQRLLLEESGRSALLLPVIKPIGDIDEDLLAESFPVEGVPDALSPTDHLHVILGLVRNWARRTPDSPLAQDVLASGAQSFALARSLQDLVNQFETEDATADKMQGLGMLDLAGHRLAILDLLRVVMEHLPALLQEKGRLGPAARRNRMIRLEAARVATGAQLRPIIAAGSTGTNPAARDLLKAIAGHPMGAVVLPGLDRGMDDDSWQAITPEHPHYALRTLLDQWEISRHDVRPLGADEGLRMALLRETMRPAAVAEAWITQLPGQQARLQQAVQGIRIFSATDRQQEAEVIALALRRHVALDQGKAALVTPDRDLATRVKAALRRWNLTIDDSSGEPLWHKGRAALLLLVLQAVEDRFTPASLLALLHHPLCNTGQPGQQHERHVQVLELAAFRGLPQQLGLGQLATHVQARRAALVRDPHAHPLLLGLTEEDWRGARVLAETLHGCLAPLQGTQALPLAAHIQRLRNVLDALAPPPESPDTAEQALQDVLQALEDGSEWHPVEALAVAQHGILHALSRETLRPPAEDSSLAIYGLAEARLLEADFVVLGGLAEGVWPAPQESGPWLNRPMRTELGLQQPERDIGLTAHDFAMGLGHARVLLTHPARINGTPTGPSRWLLRLKTVLTMAGLSYEDLQDNGLKDVVARLDRPAEFAPRRKPQPRPAVKLRPTRFSVSRVEKLVRDSYWIYANAILRLQPLDGFDEGLDASLRGSLVHEALHRFAEHLPQTPPEGRLARLLQAGEVAFQPFIDMPEVKRFWWPRFVRMAEQLVSHEDLTLSDVTALHTEVKGRIALYIPGTEHVLTARADRIDVTREGRLRIYDYKTGSLPTLDQVASGFAPQLTLEAAIALRKGFEGLAGDRVEDVAYIGAGGGKAGVKLLALSTKHDVVEQAEKALASLTGLLVEFQLPDTPYIPRHHLFTEETASDYDHLSRRLEWQMQGQEP